MRCRSPSLSFQCTVKAVSSSPAQFSSKIASPSLAASSVGRRGASCGDRAAADAHTATIVASLRRVIDLHSTENVCVGLFAADALDSGPCWRVDGSASHAVSSEAAFAPSRFSA